MTFAYFVEFRNQGRASPDSGDNNRLGPCPATGFLGNGMQLHYVLDADVDAEHVRWRRSLEERVWETGPYVTPGIPRYRTLFRQAPGSPDDPPEGRGMGALPDLYDIDLPTTVAVLPEVRSIPFSSDTLFGESTGGPVVYTDPETRELVWIMNCIQWVEIDIDGHWTLCSDMSLWHSTLQLFWDGRRWRGGPKCEIDRGHVPLGSQPPSFITPVRW